MYRVFGDESTDETKARVFSVAGVFGGEGEWDEVKNAWLNRTGGKVFHATDCETNQGDFSEGTDAENKALYKDLTQILCRSRLMGRAHAIDLAGWRTFFPDALEDVPYYTCFRNVVHDCGKLALLSIPQDKIEFTFDNRQETNYNAGVLYSYMAQLKEWSASSFLQEKVSFASRKDVGIQVADLVARETTKHLDNIIGPVRRSTRRSMTALLDTKRFEFTFLMKEWFEGFKKDFERVAKQFGADPDEYGRWLLRNGLTHNVSNLHRHMIERWPPGSDVYATAVDWNE